MELTHQDLRAAALAPSDSYKRHLSTVADLIRRGRVREAKQMQERYEARFQLFKSQARRNVKGKKSSCPGSPPFGRIG